MSLLDYTIKKINPDLYEEMQKEVLYFRKKFAGAHEKVLRDQIFQLIEDRYDVQLLLFPVIDDDLCGFITKYKGQMFIYINSFLPFEKQIFVAAHELYHLEKGAHSELLKSDRLNQVVQDDLEENKANLFAALLLVPDESLFQELERLRIREFDDLTMLNIVKLMNAFGTAYKTIILRLYEIDFLTERQAERFLKIPDRDETQGVLYEIHRHKIGERWQERTNITRYGTLKNLILSNDELELLPKQRIIKDLQSIE